MNRKRTIFGSWKVKDPKKVFTLGMAYDSYKVMLLPKLWDEAYRKCIIQAPLFKKEEFFFSETKEFNADGSVMFESRYFTPADNREKK